MTIENEIRIAVAKNRYTNVQSEFAKHPEVDLFYDGVLHDDPGYFFKLAVAQNCIKTLEVLFSIFDERFSKDKLGHDKNLYYKKKLSDVLYAAIDSSIPAEETIAFIGTRMYEEDNADDLEDYRDSEEQHMTDHHSDTSSDHHNLTAMDLAGLPTTTSFNDDYT